MEKSDLYPSKRLRIQTHSPPSSPATILKGKEKMQDAAAPDLDFTCGICLDGGRYLRGRIDSCDHFFCFVCIMEWAKIESRCPTCKRRFLSISRPPVPGVFHCERVVDVPHRDQVYHPRGNESTTLSDPYENVNCTRCNSTADENLLLLCDLCDSAAHTYCVGLGFTVPEGDWYCSDCAASRDQHTKTQSDLDSQTQHCLRNPAPLRVLDQPISPSAPPVSVIEIVTEIPTRRTSRKSSASFPTVPPSTRAEGVENGPRTLSHCRSLHGRIRELRENWNAFRAGSVAFSSSRSTSANRVQMASDTNASSEKKSSRDSEEVNKAWKMMEMAKSIQLSQRSTKPDLSLKAVPSKFNSQNVEKEKAGTKTTDMQSICKGPGSALLSGCSESASTKQDKSSLTNGCIGNEDHHKGNQGAVMCADESSIPGNNSSKSSRKGDSVGRSRTTNNTAKDEIQSLVKLNLKLVNRDRRLATEQFKDIARVATHTILAACGLEHSRSSVCSFSSLICRHNKQIGKSSLLPNSCRECFYAFVKNVVDTVVSEKALIPNS